MGAATHTITINPGDTASNLANNINAIFGSSIASINSLGQLALKTTGNVTLADISTGVQGMASLGFTFGTTNAQNPTFQVQVGAQTPVTVTVAPGTTAATLLASLNAIPNLIASLNGSGQLVLALKEGGGLTLTDGPGSPLAAMGMNVTNVAQTPFRQTNLGPNGTLSTGLVSNATLQTFAGGILTSQAEDAQNADTTATQEKSYLQTLDQNNNNTSGVNIDQEMARMIQIQSNYTAAARMITTSQKLLDDPHERHPVSLKQGDLNMSVSSIVSFLAQSDAQISRIGNTQKQMSDLERQVTTAKKHDTMAGLGAQTQQVLQLHAEQSNLTAFNANIGTASTNINIMNTALTQVGTALTNMISMLEPQAAAGAPNITDINTLAQQMLSFVSDIANTNVGGQYLFAGHRRAEPARREPVRAQHRHADAGDELAERHEHDAAVPDQHVRAQRLQPRPVAHALERERRQRARGRQPEHLLRHHRDPRTGSRTRCACWARWPT